VGVMVEVAMAVAMAEVAMVAVDCSSGMGL
jgi:hypothetical protein